jgi:hypothetical protein
MTLRILGAALLLLCVGATNARADETIVLFRHAEKMSGGYGQLTCQGLNRALALPQVLFSRYGQPDWAYAPDPGAKISESAGSFYYVRPLATIEPAAIRAGISVNTHYGYTDIVALQSLLITGAKANDTIYVAWEHEYLVKLAQRIMNVYGGGATVPGWISGDYDAVYVIRVHYGSSGITATFDREWQGLNNQSTTCP